MKRTILKILFAVIVGITNGIAQNEMPFYEQIAFEFYQTEILTKNPIDKKLTLFSELKPSINLDMVKFSFTHNNGIVENPFWYPKCNDDFNNEFNKTYKNKYWSNLKNNLSNKNNLDLSKLDQNQFSIKKYGKGKFPRLYIDQSISILDSKLTIVNVNLIKRDSGTIYHIQIDKNGKVTDWCKTEYIE